MKIVFNEADIRNLVEEKLDNDLRLDSTLFEVTIHVSNLDDAPEQFTITVVADDGNEGAD